MVSQGTDRGLTTGGGVSGPRHNLAVPRAATEGGVTDTREGGTRGPDGPEVGFVVAGVLGRLVPAEDTSSLPIDEAFDVCTVQRLSGYVPPIAQSEYSLIAGATVEDRATGVMTSRRVTQEPPQP